MMLNTSNTIAQTNFEASRFIHDEHDHYLTLKKATTAYLRLEEEIILNSVHDLPQKNRNFSLDLGCGTGRISLLINSYFKNLISLDISDEMLAIAKSKNYESPPQFIKHDFNCSLKKLLPPKTKADFICASFGAGSCIENLDHFLNDSLPILNDHGKIILSFYNKNYHAITTNSNDLPFSGMLHPKDDLVLVEHKSKVMQIKIKSYLPQEIQQIIHAYSFSKHDFYFLPTLSGLIKSDLLQDSHLFEKILDIDRSLLYYENTVSAPYILLVLTR